MTFTRLINAFKTAGIPSHLPLTLDSHTANKHILYIPKVDEKTREILMEKFPWGGDDEASSVHFEFIFYDIGDLCIQLHWGGNKQTALNALSSYLDSAGIIPYVHPRRHYSKKIPFELKGEGALNVRSFNDDEFERCPKECVNEIVGRAWNLMEHLFYAVSKAYGQAYLQKK